MIISPLLPPRAPKRIKTGGSGGYVHPATGGSSDGSQQQLLPAWALALIIIGAIWVTAYLFVLVVLCYRENSLRRERRVPRFRAGHVLWKSIAYTTPVGLVAWAVRRWRAGREAKRQQQQGRQQKTEYDRVGGLRQGGRGGKKVDHDDTSDDDDDDDGSEERRGFGWARLPGGSGARVEGIRAGQGRAGQGEVGVTHGEEEEERGAGRETDKGEK